MPSSYRSSCASLLYIGFELLGLCLVDVVVVCYYDDALLFPMGPLLAADNTDLSILALVLEVWLIREETADCCYKLVVLCYKRLVFSDRIEVFCNFYDLVYGLLVLEVDCPITATLLFWISADCCWFIVVEQIVALTGPLEFPVKPNVFRLETLFITA